MNYAVNSVISGTYAEDNQSILFGSTILYGEQDNTSEYNGSLFSEFSDSTDTSSLSSDMNKTGLSICYTNADILMNKIDELRIRSYATNFDIVVVTKVYPKNIDSSSIFLSEVSISGYKSFSSNVCESSRGVIIYVKQYLPASLRMDLTNHNFLESV